MDKKKHRPKWAALFLLRIDPSLHVFDHGLTEFTAFKQGGLFHEAFEVVGDSFLSNGSVHALDDKIGGFGPAEVAEHHFAGEDERAGVDLIFAGIFGGGAVGGFEDGNAALVVDVGSGGDADTADLSS